MWAFLASSALANPVTVSAVTSEAALVTLGAMSAILLIVLLILKELLAAYAAEPHVRATLTADGLESFGRAANSAIIPLTIVFAVAVLVKVISVL